MKLRSLLTLSLLFLPSYEVLASQQAEEPKVVTCRVQNLDDEIKQVTPGRKFHSTRAIVEPEVLALRKVLLTAKFPMDFSWHGGRIKSTIVGVIGSVPEALKGDENPTGRLFNYSVPDLSFEELRYKPIPDYDMVLRYLDPEQKEHFFAVALAENKFVGKPEEAK